MECFFFLFSDLVTFRISPVVFISSTDLRPIEKLNKEKSSAKGKAGSNPVGRRNKHGLKKTERLLKYGYPLRITSIIIKKIYMSH